MGLEPATSESLVRGTTTKSPTDENRNKSTDAKVNLTCGPRLELLVSIRMNRNQKLKPGSTRQVDLDICCCFILAADDDDDDDDDG